MEYISFLGNNPSDPVLGRQWLDVPQSSKASLDSTGWRLQSPMPTLTSG